MLSIITGISLDLPVHYITVYRTSHLTSAYPQQD